MPRMQRNVGTFKNPGRLRQVRFLKQPWMRSANSSTPPNFRPSRPCDMSCYRATFSGSPICLRNCGLRSQTSQLRQVNNAKVVPNRSINVQKSEIASMPDFDSTPDGQVPEVSRRTAWNLPASLSEAICLDGAIRTVPLPHSETPAWPGTLQ